MSGDSPTGALFKYFARRRSVKMRLSRQLKPLRRVGAWWDGFPSWGSRYRRKAQLEFGEVHPHRVVSGRLMFEQV